MTKVNCKKIRLRNFKNWKVLKIENKFYINKTNLNPYIVYKGVKFYNIEKKELRKEGFRFRKIIDDYSKFEKHLFTHELIFFLEAYEPSQVILESFGYKFKSN